MDEARRVCSKCGESYAPDVIFCPRDGTPLGARKTEILDDPYVDLDVAGQFHIRQLIGIGAMGRVYRAHQRGIDRDVAIKILHRDLLRNPTVISRFHREAKVASRLQHPNVVQVLMTGALEKNNADVGGEGYLVMEYLDGISLRSALAATGGAMPLPRALHAIVQVCDAVGEAHSQGIVHRDLKPENVMLVRRGGDDDFVKVLDFGVARIAWADGSVATQAGVIFGTARYISPEGATGEPVGAPGDVYSIATMLYQCLCGETPFDADNPVGILIKHTSEAPRPLRSIPRASYVPEPIARVVDANLAKDPGARCRDARELGRALVDAARESGLSPDDVVSRSTLLGARGALSLASMERTKQLELSGDAAARMAAGMRNAGGTALVEPGGGGTRVLEDAPASDRTSAPPSAPRQSAPRQSSPPGAPRSSVPPSVDPTIADEPASGLLSSPRLSEPPISAAGATASASYPPPASRPSTTSAAWIEDHEPPASPVRRMLVIIACFVAGALIVTLGAIRLGVFASHEVTPQTYVERARAAMAANAWDNPPGENVRDLTNVALERWPQAPSIIAVRRDAARRLVQRARAAGDAERDQARHDARLALELDPANEDARVALAGLEPAPREAPPAATPPASATSPRRTDKKPGGMRVTPPAASATPEPAGSAPPAPTASSVGGRWL